MSKYSLTKSERLSRDNDITQLFELGDSTHTFPITIKYLISKCDATFHSPSVKVGFVVPKRKIKLAVTRNRIKRKMREFYRINKHLLINFCESNAISINLMFIYSNHDSKHIERADKKMIKLLNKLLDAIKTQI